VKAQLLAAAQAAQDSAARAAAARGTGSNQSNHSGQSNTAASDASVARSDSLLPVGPIPAPSSGAAAAIAYARAQIGKPYQWGGSGPNSFDCSGLTMMAWAAAGVSMPHYSGAQYAMFPHVPFNDLEPGDLLFWGPGGSEHVAMYIGGGLQIAATHTGDYVRIQPMGQDPVGAARP
jgi:cell wall-associated NlpC family hydrolase